MLTPRTGTPLDGDATPTLLRGRVRVATDGERSALVELLASTTSPGEATCDVAVVFAYPGLGVGESHLELAGCTSQVLQLSTAGLRLTSMGIQVVGLSTEQHAHVGWLARHILRAGEDATERLPHVDTATGRYLERFTVVIGGRHDGMLVTHIEDSAAHTLAVIELLER